ncbi:MAG TPA: hypothetical protein VMH22_12695 [bacterium]|nr:hypothetical protein [bacterium]
MKPKWAVNLLVLSLLGNVVVLGWYGWHFWSGALKNPRYSPYQWIPDYVWRGGRGVVVRSFEPKMQTLWQRKKRWMLESRYQDFQEPPDTAMDRIALDSEASIARQAFKLIYQSRRTLPQSRDIGPLKRIMEKRWRQQMGLDD